MALHRVEPAIELLDDLLGIVRIRPMMRVPMVVMKSKVLQMLN